MSISSMAIPQILDHKINFAVNENKQTNKATQESNHEKHTFIV